MDLDGWALQAWPNANTLTPKRCGRGQAGKLGSVACRCYRMGRACPSNRTRQRRTRRSAPASTRACWQFRWRVACVTSPTCTLWPTSLASFADRQPCDAHHLRFAQSHGFGLKVSDEFTVPLCRAHHRELHRTGKETDWWATAGLEPIALARKLWLETHPLAASADVLGDGSEKAGAANDEAMSPKPRKPRMAKRTRLPGSRLRCDRSNPTAATPNGAPARKRETAKRALPRMPFAMA